MASLAAVVGGGRESASSGNPENSDKTESHPVVSSIALSALQLVTSTIAPAAAQQSQQQPSQALTLPASEKSAKRKHSTIVSSASASPSSAARRLEREDLNKKEEENASSEDGPVAKKGKPAAQSSSDPSSEAASASSSRPASTSAVSVGSAASIASIRVPSAAVSVQRASPFAFPLRPLTAQAPVKPTKEVELKVKISKEDLNALKIRLRSMTAFTLKEEIHQEDHYLDDPDNSFYAPNSTNQGTNLRIRKCPNQSSLCLKIAHKGRTENDFYRQEFEIKVDDPDKLMLVFLQLGYVDSKTLTKDRTVFTYGDYEITLDDISGVGCMVEIEMQKHVDDHATCINEMEAFLQTTLGITSYTKEMHGVEAYMKKAAPST